MSRELAITEAQSKGGYVRYMCENCRKILHANSIIEFFEFKHYKCEHCKAVLTKWKKGV